MSLPPPSGGNSDDDRALALAVRDACRAALVAAWEDARLSGLCDEGAWEVALGALARLTPDELLARARRR